jgi:protoporphyrinogen oxidase
MRVGIIGGGIAGLVAAYELSKTGAAVTLFERAPKLGGLAGSFRVGDGQEVEKYYHFICKPDRDYFEMMEELGLRSRLRWVTTDMGFFFNGSLYTLGDPLSLFAFPHLSPRDKLRFVWSTLRAKLRSASSWRDIENVPARAWLVRQYGERTYRMLYAPLLESKFREYTPSISAAWMWARFYRLGNSRTITQKERLGYLTGGSQAYIDALERAIRSRGVEVRTSSSVEQIVTEAGTVSGVRCDGTLLSFDAVLSTVPIPHTAELFAELDGPYFDNLRQLKYIGVMVMLLRIRQRFSKYFWMNVSDPRMDISGIIEYTNLNPLPELGGDSILYIPQYLPHTHTLYTISNDDLFERYCSYLKLINPRFERDWISQYWVHRDRFAQPICELGFSKHVPDIRTPIRNLYLTDSYQLHPHDRSISDSTRLGRRAARAIASTATETQGADEPVKACVTR